ncbi:unnamed protein product, partial [marine sediment metagenome]
NIQDQCVGTTRRGSLGGAKSRQVGKAPADHAAPGFSTGLLQFTGDNRDGMTEGIEDVALVAARAERAGGIDFPAGIKQQGLIVQHYDEGADIVVVVMLLVVAALEGNGQTRGRIRTRPGD